jgi:hypothetical protein
MMDDYIPVFNITPEILSLTYKIAGTLERINIIREGSNKSGHWCIVK